MDRRTDVKNNVALAHPYHKKKSCRKFSYILPSGFGGACVTDRLADRRQTDEQIMLLLHTLIIRELASLVKFHSVVYRICLVIRQGFSIPKQFQRSRCVM